MQTLENIAIAIIIVILMTWSIIVVANSREHTCVYYISDNKLENVAYIHEPIDGIVKILHDNKTIVYYPVSEFKKECKIGYLK